MGLTRVEKAYRILRGYSGTNNQILLWQLEDRNSSLILSEFQIEYILGNHDYEKNEVKKVVQITKDLGKMLKEKHFLNFTPERIFIDTIIGEMGGSYHLYIKLTTKGNLILTYVKKCDIITPLNVVDYTKTEVDFDKFNKITEKINRKILPHQEEAIKFLITNKKSILADSMGLGKAQPVSTVIPTPQGPRAIGTLKVGDQVYGSDGKVHNVIGVFPQGVKKTYRLYFTDNTEARCCDEHLWIVKDRSKLKPEWGVVRFKDIFDGGWFYQSAKTYARLCYEIPISKAVESDEVEHYIHPYVLGLYLGDKCKEPVIDTMSLPLPRPVHSYKDEVNSLLKDGYTVQKRKWLDLVYRYRVIGDDELNEENNKFGQEIERMGLKEEPRFRFIPTEYMNGSVEQRLSLIQGIMDADGKFGRGGTFFKFSTFSEKLAWGMRKLILSLGGIANIKRKKMKKHPYRMEYIIEFNLYLNPFRVGPQAERFNEKPEKYAEYSRLIRNAAKDKEEECVCIKVDSDDESYLTEDYVVTHNTITSIVSALAGDYNKILVITKANLKTQWKQEISLYENPDNIEIVKGSKWTPGKKFTVINYDIIKNFYEVPKEIEYQTEPDGKGGRQFVLDSEGNRVPVWVMNKNTGMYEPKMIKSRKKDIINEAMDNSPLYNDEYDCIIIDECHLLSNNKSKRYDCISDFLKRSRPKAIYLLTGTPITKNTEKFANILKLINHPVVGNHKYYMERYCGAKEHTFRGVKRLIPEGSTNLEELKDKIKDSYIRRVFEDLPNMPDKTVITKEFDLDDRQHMIYSRLWDEYLEAQYNIDPYNSSSDYQQLIEGGIVRRFLAMEMVENTIELVDAEIEDGHKVVVMCNFVDELNKFKEYYKDKCVVYDGSNTVTQKQKDAARDAFLKDPNVMVFVGNIASASVGLNLDVSKTLIFNSYSWVYADNAQAEDRIYRVTQKENCKVVYMLWTDSISKDMYDKVMLKKMVANTVIKKENDK